MVKRIWLGIFVSVIFLSLLVLRIDDFSESKNVLLNANYLYIFPAALVYLISFLFRAIRWSYILQPISPNINFFRLYPVIMVGYMANNLLPARLGEIVRAYYLSIRESVRTTTAIATILAERVFDGITLITLLFLSLIFLPVNQLADKTSDALGVPQSLILFFILFIYLLALALVAVLAKKDNWFKAFINAATRIFPPKAAGVIEDFSDRFLAGFSGLGSPKRLIAILLMSLPVWLIEGLVFYIVAYAFSIDTYFSSEMAMVGAIVLTLAVSNLATSLPSSQGGIGPFEFFAVIVLEALGVNPEVALAYVIVLHFTVLAPTTIAGLLHIMAKGIGLKQLINKPPELEPRTRL